MRTENERLIVTDLQTIIDQSLLERQDLLAHRDQRWPDLPLKFWRQQAHFTTPATGTPERAIRGLSPVQRLLDRHQISIEELSSASGASLTWLNRLLQEQPVSPLVMVDAEDAVADNPESAVLARQQSIDCFCSAQWGSALRFFRPAGLRLESCVEDIATVISGCIDPNRQGYARLPLDGIIWPKIEDPDEMAWLCQLLSRLEQAHELPPNSIKVQYLVESAAALAQLREISAIAAGRLCGMIWGAADYAADVGLPFWTNNHPLFDQARMNIINVAGMAGVPAIDAMTFNYPTPVHRGEGLSFRQKQQNHDSILTALVEVYNDAVHGRDLGMSGKWVGHPAQLLMVLVAYHEQISEQQVEKTIDALNAYQSSVEQGKGATILAGPDGAQMADRATDRHLRIQLRRAAAIGVLAADRAFQAGVITAEERDELRQTSAH